MFARRAPGWAKTYSMADLSASPRDAQAIRVNVVLNGHAAYALLDSGSSVSLLSKSVADSVGVHYLGSNAELVGIGRRSLPTWLVHLQSFKVGDESINNAQLRVAQPGPSRPCFWEWISYGRGRKLDSSGGPPPIIGMPGFRLFWKSHCTVSGSPQMNVLSITCEPVCGPSSIRQ